MAGGAAPPKLDTDTVVSALKTQRRILVPSVRSAVCGLRSVPPCRPSPIPAETSRFLHISDLQNLKHDDVGEPYVLSYDGESLSPKRQWDILVVTL
jgi:hypothetical protein